MLDGSAIMAFVGTTDAARARAFYRRYGFSVEGAAKVHEGSGAPEIRMIRDKVSHRL